MQRKLSLMVLDGNAWSKNGLRRLILEYSEKIERDVIGCAS